MTEPRRCKVCNNPEDEHPFRHPFVAEGDEGGAVHNEKKKTPRTEGRLMASVGGDPALRLALMNAGVITYADLARAEEELQHARASGVPAVADAKATAGTEGGSTNADSGP